MHLSGIYDIYLWYGFRSRTGNSRSYTTGDTKDREDQGRGRTSETPEIKEVKEFKKRHSPQTSPTKGKRTILYPGVDGEEAVDRRVVGRTESNT